MRKSSSDSTGNGDRDGDGEARRSDKQGDVGEGVRSTAEVTEDRRRVAGDKGEDSGAGTGDLAPSGAQGLGSALLVLEEALRLLHVPGDRFGIRLRRGC